ncbi:hypothetical protein [uncultured Lacinutrix sp.]|uniref:hypothetical protein n=1 Tax=uncultured Lacinutrix sp. TaxID=574032 RepID=UPI002630C534|nr:hypothetical protein [uncultured Lacinutrix sp.]
MENNINTIDLINAYIDNTLSNEERLAFENRLEIDTELNTLYNEQLAIIEGIKRVEIGKEIQVARQHYVRGKWSKYIGISIAIILVSAIIYNIVFKAEEPQIVEPVYNNEIEVVIDSMIVKKASEEKIETKNVDEQSKIGTTLKAEEIIKLEEDKAEVKEPFEEDKTEVVEKELENIGVIEPLSPELNSFYNSVKKAPQVIEINTEKRFTVTCKEGTVLTIPAKSFVDSKTGRLARGTINLEVTEYYKLSDMLLANLSTKSDDKQLETGGMLYINANKKGKKLRLKQGKRIQVAFNNSDKKNMQLFSGEEHNDSVNWRLQDQIGNTKEIVEEDVEVSFDVIQEVPIYPGCEDGNNDMRRKCMSDKISSFVSENFDRSIAEDLRLTGLQKINMFFEIDKAGDIGKIDISASRKELGEEAIRVIESMPKLKPGKQRGHLVRTTFFLPFSIALEGKTINQAPVSVRSDRKFIKEFENRMDSTRSIQGTRPITNNDIERYAFSTSKLGWLNCDRFARTTSKKIKYKFKLKDSKGASVKMVFKSMSSILPSIKRNSDYEFGWVPKDEEVILIAIKWKGNKLYLGKKTANTKIVQDLNLNFKEVTVHELKKELETLDNGFN